MISQRASRNTPARRRVFIVILLLPSLILAELATWALYRLRYPRLEAVRQRLLSDAAPSYSRCISQPYLLYTPAPGDPDHNREGYRGQAVPMRRQPGTRRVLCLGGSTTYGWGVPKASQAWPARLEALLQAQAPAGERLEVINGGLPYGTTAELLTHYVLKFSYFRPDLVIINTGGNDVDAVLAPHYQPDYSHWRQEACPLSPLPVYSRWLMHSRLASLAMILLVYGKDVDPGRAILRTDGSLPPTHWYPGVETEAGEPVIPDGELAFAHNLDVLVAAIRHEGSQVLLVPFRPAPHYAHSPAHLRGFERDERALERIAAREGVPVAPFPADVIPEGEWLDNCHVGPLGQEAKARYVAPFAASLLWPAAGSGEARPGPGAANRENPGS